MNDKANANDNKIKIMKKAIFSPIPASRHQKQMGTLYLPACFYGRGKNSGSTNWGRKKTQQNWGIESACSGDADLENCRWIELI